MPSGLSPAYSRSHGCLYHENADTGKETLEKSPRASSISRATESMPSGWSTEYSRIHGRMYYYHAATGKVTWEIPTSNDDFNGIGSRGSVCLGGQAQTPRAVPEIPSSEARVPEALAQVLSPPSISFTKANPELLAHLRECFGDDDGAVGDVVRRSEHGRTREPYTLNIVQKYSVETRSMLPELLVEVRRCSTLKHHHILQLISFLEDETYVYMYFEHCAGGSLRTLCAQQPDNRLEENRAARYFAQICKGIDYMHQHLCAHRHLKLEAVFLTGQDEVRICDFGWNADAQFEQAVMLLQAPHRWPPELFKGEKQDFAADLWALGTLLYELLVGRVPFEGKLEEIQRKVLGVELRYPPGLPSRLAINLISCLLQQDPERRLSVRLLLMTHPWVHRNLGVASDCSGSTKPSSKQLPASVVPTMASTLTPMASTLSHGDVDYLSVETVTGTERPTKKSSHKEENCRDLGSPAEMLTCNVEVHCSSSPGSSRGSSPNVSITVPCFDSDVDATPGQSTQIVKVLPTCTLSSDIARQSSAQVTKPHVGSDSDSTEETSGSDHERGDLSSTPESSPQITKAVPVLKSESGSTPESSPQASNVLPIFDSDSDTTPESSIQATNAQSVSDFDSNQETCGSDHDYGDSGSTPELSPQITKALPVFKSESGSTPESSPQVPNVLPIFDSDSDTTPESSIQATKAQEGYDSDSNHETCGSDRENGGSGSTPESSPQVTKALPVLNSDSVSTLESSPLLTLPMRDSDLGIAPEFLAFVSETQAITNCDLTEEAKYTRSGHEPPAENTMRIRGLERQEDAQRVVTVCSPSAASGCKSSGMVKEPKPMTDTRRFTHEAPSATASDSKPVAHQLRSQMEDGTQGGTVRDRLLSLLRIDMGSLANLDEQPPPSRMEKAAQTDALEHGTYSVHEAQSDVRQTVGIEAQSDAGEIVGIEATLQLAEGSELPKDNAIRVDELTASIDDVSADRWGLELALASEMQRRLDFERQARCLESQILTKSFALQVAEHGLAEREGKLQSVFAEAHQQASVSRESQKYATEWLGLQERLSTLDVQLQEREACEEALLSAIAKLADYASSKVKHDLLRDVVVVALESEPAGSTFA